MSLKDVVSTVFLFLGVLLGPAIFFVSVIAYGVKRGSARLSQYQEHRYWNSLPCGRCQYFTRSEYLNCAVNPLQVLTDEACHCRDFAVIEPSEATNDYNSYLGNHKH